MSLWQGWCYLAAGRGDGAHKQVAWGSFCLVKGDLPVYHVLGLARHPPPFMES